MKAHAAVHLQFSSEKLLKSFADALSPEVNQPVVSRAKVALENEKTYLVLRVDADNTIALRSTLNAYLRLINSITSVIELLERSS